MRTARVAALVLATAATANATDELFSFSFTGDCVSAVVASPAWRLNRAKETAEQEFRKPTPAELAVGSGFDLMVWNSVEIQCRDIRVKEVVITDAGDNVRARYPLRPTAETRVNAFGVSGTFYTAHVQLTRAAVAQAFAQDGRLHVVTNAGRRTAPFDAILFADAVAYETEAQRTARQLKKEAERKALEEAKFGGTIAINAERMATACNAGTSGTDAYLALTDVIRDVAGSGLPKEMAIALLQPYSDCLKAKKGTPAHYEANTLLNMLQ